MGVSHVGVAYVKDGKLHNIDNPLTEEYNGRGMRGDLTQRQLQAVSIMHVIRPRGLTEAQRANLLAWITRFNSNAKQIYPSSSPSTSDYNAPKYQAGQPVEFVKRLGADGARADAGPPIALYCSEFAWSLLALRDCDPARTARRSTAAACPRACVSRCGR